MADMGPWERAEDLDSWSTGRGLVGQERYLSCSFCGSLNPDTFMELVEQGYIVGPTDKTYKAYLNGPIDDALVAQRKAQWMGQSFAAAMRKFLADEGKADDEIATRLEAEWATAHAPMLTGPTVAKFYYQHLSRDQKQRFVDLYNDRTMKIGYPGRFYVSPFFMVDASTAQA